MSHFKNIYYTLDFESDIAGVSNESTYEAVSKTDQLVKFSSDNSIPLTVFCEGEIIKKYYEYIEPLINIGADVELHSYNHSALNGTENDKINNFYSGLDEYTRMFGRIPNGYRAPAGMISDLVLYHIDQVGIKYDSSVFPTYFPGRFNFMHCPDEPFKVNGINTLEIPLSVVPIVRLPISLSYMQLIGSGIFKVLHSLFGSSDNIVLDFHMHDIVKGGWLSHNGISFSAKYGYRRAQSHSNPMNDFIELFEYFSVLGFKARPLSYLYQKSISMGDDQINQVDSLLV